jgi:hypothetical protein
LFELFASLQFSVLRAGLIFAERPLIFSSATTSKRIPDQSLPNEYDLFDNGHLLLVEGLWLLDGSPYRVLRRLQRFDALHDRVQPRQAGLRSTARVLPFLPALK